MQAGQTCIDIFRSLSELMVTHTPIQSPPVAFALRGVPHGYDSASSALTSASAATSTSGFVSSAVSPAAPDDTVQCLHVIALMRQLMLFAKVC